MKCLCQARKVSCHLFLCKGYRFCLFLRFFYWTLEQCRHCGIFLLDFGTVPTLWYFSIWLWNSADIVVFLFFYWTLEQCRHCGIFVFLLDFGTVPDIVVFLFFYWTLEQCWHCGIFVFLLNFGTVPTLWYFCFFHFIVTIYSHVEIKLTKHI